MQGPDRDETERKARDRVLRAAALAGDESAWAALHAQAFDALYASVHRRAGPDLQEIEDVVQETWMVAVRRLRDFDPNRGSFLAWLRGISFNVLRNRRRRRSEWASGTHEDERGREPEPPLALVDGEQVAMAMAGLPERYRAVLRAKYAEQLSVSEIASRWQETPKAVESLLSRARAAFRGAYRRLDPRR